MHILSSHNRSEFLACPYLVRFDHVHGQGGLRPTLLVKASTLLSKYIVMGARMQLVLARLGGRLFYGLKVFDAPENAPILWSVCEQQNELSAILGLSRGEALSFFLFNELAVNIAWKEISPIVSLGNLVELTDGVTLGTADYAALGTAALPVFESMGRNVAVDNGVVVDIDAAADWHMVRSTYITNRATTSRLDIFDVDEGGQQEQLGIWLVDSLHPEGAHHSPQIKGKHTRELTDILLSHQYGSFLIESKALSVWGRGSLPSRARLAKNVSAHVSKAVSQLAGGIRKVRAGVPITSVNGDSIEIERTQPAHAVVLIPDLGLIENREVYDRAFIAKFMEATGGFLHLLDIAELLRMAQAAEMIAARGATTTPMMAFDYYLMERAKKAHEAGSLCFEMLLRFTD